MSTEKTRRQGALWGQAVGDALGTTAEFMATAQVRERTPAAWPEHIVGGGAFGVEPGQVTDDTELALALAHSLVRTGSFDLDDIARSYVRWRASDPFDVGGATHQAFGGALEEGISPAATVAGRASRRTEANGSVMRVSPLGLFGVTVKRNQLGAWARAESALSHPSEVTQWASAVFTTTIADAIATGDAGEALFQRALQYARGSPIEPTLRAAVMEFPVSDQANAGWVRIAVQHAFFHLRRGTPFGEALKTVVLQGGDSDTNAAITGALLGAAQGLEAIPPGWLHTVRTCVTTRPPEYRTDTLDQLIEQLADAGAR